MTAEVAFESECEDETTYADKVRIAKEVGFPVPFIAHLVDTKPKDIKIVTAAMIREHMQSMVYALGPFMNDVLLQHAVDCEKCKKVLAN